MRKLVGPAVTTGTPLGAGASNESKYLRGNLPLAVSQNENRSRIERIRLAPQRGSMNHETTLFHPRFTLNYNVGIISTVFAQSQAGALLPG